MEDSRSRENLSFLYYMINEKWNISDKVVAMTHDNASNISMAADLSNV